MRHYILYTVVIAGILFGWQSCDSSFLDKYPQTSIAPDEFFKTEEDLALYIDGLLDIKDKYAYEGEQGTDNLSTTGSREIKNIMTGNPSSENIVEGWDWERLRDINYFLEHAPRAEVTEEAYHHYVGLARMYRAIFYYEKVKRFSDVPWYSTTLSTSDEEELYRPRDPRSLVVDSLMADLKFAYEHVREEVTEGTPGKWVAAVEYARIALNEASWRKYHPELELEETAEEFFRIARKVSGEIIDSGEFEIYNTGHPDEDYKTLFTSLDLTGNPEVILPHIYDDALGHGLEVSTIFTDYEQCPTRELMQTYLMRDGSRFTDIDGYKEMTFVEEFEDRDYRLKSSFAYPGWINRGDRDPYIQNLNKNFTGYHQIKGYDNHRENEINRSIDMPAYRYAEVLLIHAEAAAELGEVDQAIIDRSINLLRDRAGVAPLNVDLANQNPDPFLMDRYPHVKGDHMGVLLEIRRERRVELAFEDFRFDDLMRWEAADLLLEPSRGMYFPGLGRYDMDGDGIVDIELISKDEDIPFEEEKYTNEKGKKLIYYRVSTIEDGTGTVYLEFGDEGGEIITEDRERIFEKPKYYYRPIPETQMILNPNLEQIFGW